MYKVLTATGKNQRGFPIGKEQEAFSYYNEIKDLGRTELHNYFIAIYPKNLYSNKSDNDRANMDRQRFLDAIK